jgi:hypothetical protein
MDCVLSNMDPKKDKPRPVKNISILSARIFGQSIALSQGPGETIEGIGKSWPMLKIVTR